MRQIVWAIGLWLVPVIGLAADFARTLEHGGEARRYLLHIPEGLEVPEAGVPVVLVLHGLAQSAQGMAGFSGFNATADRERFVVAYPEGTGPALLRNWNEGSAWKSADDVGFIARVIDDLGAVLKVDPDRVYATGMSNGGMMCYRLASELSDRIAAIAPVSGTMATQGIQATRPVSVMHVHGTEDGLVPYGGLKSRGRGRMIDFASVEASVASWAKFNGCPTEARVEEELPDRDPGDGTRVKRSEWGPGREGSLVVLDRIEGGGHTWPGGLQNPAFLGRTTRDMDDPNGAIWRFFAAHPRGGLRVVRGGAEPDRDRAGGGRGLGGPGGAQGREDNPAELEHAVPPQSDHG
jgi:polyhydroxybutyrate depolymerase